MTDQTKDKTSDLAASLSGAPRRFSTTPAEPVVPEAAELPATQAVKADFTQFVRQNITPIIGGLVIAGFLIASVFMITGVRPSLPSFGTQKIVVFDPVKFLNAQRAAASILAVNPNAELTLTLTQVAKQAEAVIKEEANGAVVVVRQAVVVPDEVQDITDAVLIRFGLPTDAPTVSTRMETLESIAPTESSFSPGRFAEDRKIEKAEKATNESARSNREFNQNQIVP